MNISVVFLARMDFQFPRPRFIDSLSKLGPRHDLLFRPAFARPFYAITLAEWLETSRRRCKKNGGVTRGTREDKSIVESVVVCSTGNRNAFPLRAIGRDDTPQQWPTLLIHRASFSRGSFIINSTCHCSFDIRANSRKRKKIDALPSTRRHA